MYTVLRKHCNEFLTFSILKIFYNKKIVVQKHNGKITKNETGLTCPEMDQIFSAMASHKTEITVKVSPGLSR